MKKKSLLYIVGMLFVLAGCFSEEKKVSVHEVAKLKPQAPMAMLGAGTSGGQMGSAGSNSGSLAWKVPQGWSEKESSSSMRLASFSTGKSDGPDVSIVALGAMAGDESSNVNRWRGQVGLGSTSPQSIAESARSEKGGLGDFKWYKIEGSENGIYVAVIKPGDQTIFVKMMGVVKDLKKSESSFIKLAKSIKRKS